MKFHKHGFTLVELLLMFFFLFAMVAAVTPVITRKHKDAPEKKIHGFYACYRDENDNLRETIIKNSKVVEDNALVEKCQFQKPKKAMYYYVQVIGAGGGGANVTTLDENLFVTPSHSGTAGSIACGYGTGNDYCSLDWSKIGKLDFAKLTQIDVQLIAHPTDGYACPYGVACPWGLKASGLYYCQASGLTEEVDGATCTGSSTYTCKYSSDETSACPNGWEKTQTELSVTCKNPNAGLGGTYYYTTPLIHGLEIKGTKTGYKTGSVTVDDKTYKQAYSGYGVTYEWNGNKMVTTGGEGAIAPMTHGDYYSNSTSKRCLDTSVYPTIYQPSDSTCYMTSGTCSTTSTGGYDFGSISLSQYDYYQTQNLSFGIGGDAGTVKSMVLRKIPTNIVLDPGKGGKVGQDGGATTFGNYVASGGEGSTTTNYITITLTPELPSSSASSSSQPTRLGGKAIFDNFLKFVLSYRLRDLRDRLSIIGAGGDGASIKTECTYGYKYTPLVLKSDSTEISKYYVGKYNVQPSVLSTIDCNGHSWNELNEVEGYGYWSGALSVDNAAQKGGSGAIIIAW
jgi:hypothetical protein